MDLDVNIATRGVNDFPGRHGVCSDGCRSRSAELSALYEVRRMNRGAQGGGFRTTLRMNNIHNVRRG